MDDYTPPQRSVSLFEAMQTYVPEKPIRQQLIDEAFKKCNASRKRAGYKPLPISFYAVRVNSSCKTDTDVHYFLKRCREGDFSKVFFGATKVVK